ncbi:MAG: acyl-[acyl-carrier-protein]--UDP-N-acetylglucosamine O-acyltransferase, partial [Pseudomonadota bacterium]
MIRGTTGISKDIIPYTTVGGQPARHYRLNLVGLRRAGIEGARLKAISVAIRRLRKREDLEGLDETPEVLHLREWLAVHSKRGISKFVDMNAAE